MSLKIKKIGFVAFFFFVVFLLQPFDSYAYEEYEGSFERSNILLTFEYSAITDSALLKYYEASVESDDDTERKRSHKRRRKIKPPVQHQ